MVYESRFPKEVEVFYKQSIREGISTEALNLERINDYLKTLTDSNNLMKHKEIFRNNLGDYWDFLISSFREATILERYYLLETITKKYGTDWLGNKQRFS